MNRFFNQFRYFFYLIVLIAISIFLVYYIPAAFNRLLFLLFLIPIWKSKKDFIWFAFILVLLDSPGGLFSGGMVDDPYRLPIYSLASGVSFSFEELYFFTILLKGIFKKRFTLYKTFAYRKQYRYLAFYFLLLIFVSFILGTSFNSLKGAYKTVLSISIFLSTIFIFAKEEDVLGFFKTLFPFAFVALLLQMYGLVYHRQIVALFKPSATIIQGILSEGQLMRPIEMSVVLLICFFGALLYMNCISKPFDRYYLIIILIISFIGIILSATRTWFLGFSLMYLFYLILNYRQIGRNVLNFAAGLGVLLLVMSISPLIKTQTAQSWSRLKTIEELTQGKIIEGSMRNRAEVRGPRVMEGFNKSSILFGAGFSDLYYEYSDGHVGFQNILLNSGIIGIILLFSFAMTLFSKPHHFSKKINGQSDLKSILLNLPLIIPAVLIINSGTQFWGFDVSGSRCMFLAFYITISSLYINMFSQTWLSKNLREGRVKLNRMS